MTDVGDIRADIESCQIEVRRLQAETIHTITIKPTGKIEVVDKVQLESLNSEIDRLKDLGSHNFEILARLIDVVGESGTVWALRDQKRRVEDQIFKTKNLLRIRTGELLQYATDINPSDPFAHPKARELKAEADAALKILEPELASVTELIALAEAILEDFQPSGVKATKPEDFRRGITRESVAAFGA